MRTQPCPSRYGGGHCCGGGAHGVSNQFNRCPSTNHWSYSLNVHSGSTPRGRDQSDWNVRVTRCHLNPSVIADGRESTSDVGSWVCPRDLCCKVILWLTDVAKGWVFVQNLHETEAYREGGDVIIRKCTQSSAWIAGVACCSALERKHWYVW